MKKNIVKLVDGSGITIRATNYVIIDGLIRFYGDHDAKGYVAVVNVEHMMFIKTVEEE